MPDLSSCTMLSMKWVKRIEKASRHGDRLNWETSRGPQRPELQQALLYHWARFGNGQKIIHSRNSNRWHTQNLISKWRFTSIELEFRVNSSQLTYSGFKTRLTVP